MLQHRFHGLASWQQEEGEGEEEAWGSRMEEGVCYGEAEDTLDPEKLDLEKLAMEYKYHDLGSWQQG